MSKSELPVVVAVHRINGNEHKPGDIFVCPSREYHDDLIGLGAIRLATDEEVSVHERLQAAGARTPGSSGDGASALGGLKKPELLAIAKAENVAVESDDNKADLIRKIEEARAAAAAEAEGGEAEGGAESGESAGEGGEAPGEAAADDANAEGGAESGENAGEADGAADDGDANSEATDNADNSGDGSVDIG